MTIEVTDEDRALVHKWWSPEDGLTSRQMMLEDFSRHRQAAYDRAAKWIDDNFGADECTEFLDAMRSIRDEQISLKTRWRCRGVRDGL